MIQQQFRRNINIEITDNRHLAKLIKKFDSKHGTTTNFFTTNMSQLNDMLQIFSPSEKGKLSSVINLSWVVKRAFNGKKKMSAKDIDINNFEQVDSLHKLNALYTMLQDIRKGSKFNYPIVLTLLPNNQYVIDPGNTRMMLNHVYNKEVDVMFIRYPDTRNDLDMSNVSLCSVKNFKFHTLQDVRYRTCTTGDKDTPGLIAKYSPGIPWHWVQHSSSEYSRNQTLSKSNNRIFELRNDGCVSCNGDIFIKRDSGHKFTITL
jgi:hypothetical protein